VILGRLVLRVFAVALLSLAGLLSAAASVAQTKLPPAREVVKPSAYVSLQPVPRGRAFQLAVVMKIRPGFHVNAREASEEYLIPTDLQLAVPAGFRAGAAVYPKGKLKKFPFSPKKPLNVYAETATIRVPLTALAGAPLGPQRIPLKLRYQACSEEVCLPPVTLDLEAILDVAPADAKAKLVHPELFPK
jgi:thiol:disulfide interchange protein DsbD